MTSSQLVQFPDVICRDGALSQHWRMKGVESKCDFRHCDGSLPAYTLPMLSLGRVVTGSNEKSHDFVDLKAGWSRLPSAGYNVGILRVVLPTARCRVTEDVARHYRAGNPPSWCFLPSSLGVDRQRPDGSARAPAVPPDRNIASGVDRQRGSAEPPFIYSCPAAKTTLSPGYVLAR